MKKLDVVLGLQWGDEGKGKVVDHLASSYNVIARFQGGPNAGHSIHFEGKQFVLRSIPSGIFREGTTNIIGGGVVFDPVAFKQESEGIIAAGIDITAKLVVSKKAHLILPTHRMLDAAQEAAKGASKIGSTLKGIGPTYTDKIGRNGLRVGDILAPDFLQRYNNLKAKHLDTLHQLNFECDLAPMEEEWFKAIDYLKLFKLINCEYFVNKTLSEDTSILAEGAQGSMLDIDYGAYPFVTSSNTICPGACTGLGVAPNKIGIVYGIFKAYCTRVGSGPFPTELFDEVGDDLRKKGFEFGSVTGRPRRCGWLDLVALKYAVMLSGVSKLIMMKADVMDDFETIKAAVAYEVDGEVTDEVPFDTYSKITPIYKEFPGWKACLSSSRKEEELPANFKSYIKFIEDYIGIPIAILSVGPDRDQTIYRQTILDSILQNINSPKDIKDLSNEALEQLCEEIRQYIICSCAEHPGHIGSSLGCVEIAVALHKVFSTPEDKIVWDVGHQAYAHKIITGRRDAFIHNREFGGISGFPKMSESEYDAFGVGHASTSVSAALGYAVAAERLGKNYKSIAVIGDGALTGGLAFEGLNNAGGLKSDMLVILNDNQIAIDQCIGGLHNTLIKITTNQSYNRLKDDVWKVLGATGLRRRVQKFVKDTKRVIIKNSDVCSFFDSLGFRYFGPIDGNDIGQMVLILTRLKDIKGPKLLHVVTTKGKGYKPAEDNPTIWHAPGMYNATTGETIKQDNSCSRYQDVFGSTITRLARENDKIVGITPAMLSGSGLNIMKAEMPERVFDVGIAEGHAVTFSAGLAAGGLLPFCSIYSSFMQRAYDNVIHDVAAQNLKVIFCLDRAGVVGEDGLTHHGLYDLAAFRPIPNLAIASPRNEIELCNLLYSANLPEYPAIIIRYPRGRGIGMNWKDAPFSKIQLGKAELLKDASKPDIAVLSIGPIANKCSEAIEMAEKEGINVIHYDMKFLKPIDIEALHNATAKTKILITVEDGTTMGGLHGAVAEYIADNCLDCCVKAFGIGDVFPTQGSREQLFELYSYNVIDIYKAIKTYAKK